MSDVPVKGIWNPVKQKHENFQFVHCRKCSAELPVPLTSIRPMPAEQIARIARNKGWEATASHIKKAICPNCLKGPLKERKSMVAPMKPAETIIAADKTPNGSHIAAVVPPREPTREHKRLIFMAIEEKYTGQAYIAGHTDNTIAIDLKVPREWVKRIREEFFGADINEKLLQELALVKEAQQEILAVAKRNQERIHAIEQKLGIV